MTHPSSRGDLKDLRMIFAVAALLGAVMVVVPIFVPGNQMILAEAGLGIFGIGGLLFAFEHGSIKAHRQVQPDQGE